MAEEELLHVVFDLPTSTPSNWDDFEKLLHHGFYNELRVAPEEQAVVLSESSFTDPANREKLTQILFETFNVPAMIILSTGYLSVVAYGSETGLSIHSGETRTEIVPVVDGKVLRDLGTDYPIKGSHISAYINYIISNKFNYVPLKVWEIDSAKKHFYVSLDPNTEAENTTIVKVGQDDHEIAFGDYYWKAVEGFLYPEYFAIASDPLILAIVKVVQQCPPESREKLLANICLSGGNAEWKGLSARLEKDLSKLVGPEIKVRVKNEDGCKYHPWLGGSLVGSRSSFADKMLSKEVYDEFGPSAIHNYTY